MDHGAVSNPGNSSSNFIMPIVFNKEYDIHFFKLENLHPFDCQKWGRIAKYLDTYYKENYDREVIFLSPKRCVNKEELQVVHTKKFIRQIHNSKLTITKAAEVCILVLLPACTIRKRLLKPLKWQVAGSLLAAKAALDHGWAINLGGGFHHCSAAKAGGFCLFADITLIIRFLWNHVNFGLKVMIIDLDAHQGNGYARDVLAMSSSESRQVYILDMYNYYIYPRDDEAKEAVSRLIEIKSRTADKEYIQLLEFHLLAALKDFPPDIVIYNAGTDILVGDPLGRLSITADGVIKRDEIVFAELRARNIPIVMLTSGGYQSSNSRIVALSILNLLGRRIIEPIKESFYN